MNHRCQPIDTREAVKRLQCSRSTLHRWRKSGLLPYIRFSAHRLLYRPDEIDRFLLSQRRHELDGLELPPAKRGRAQESDPAAATYLRSAIARARRRGR